ncbi:MAG TPA: hypothetical protein VE996_04810 [Terriglobales bacterium]|nr:hypothetical protein [Terriglobales bacterium]
MVDDLDAVRGLVEETLEAMVAHGDILEHRDVEEDPGSGATTLLYAAPASFVPRESGAVILLGVTSDQLSALPDELEDRVEYAAHVRRLSPLRGENLRAELGQLGLAEVSHDRWLKAPRAESPIQCLSRADDLLDRAQPSRDVPGLFLLDPARSVRFYRGRWVDVRSQTGRFVGRRSQAYGAALWSYVQLRNGNPERLIDFPVAGGRWRGCDEAWRLQMAIDAARGEPQRFKVLPGPGKTRVIEFFSPVPMWARRRWDAVGELVPSSGCLFAYKLPEAECAEEIRFLRDELWLQELIGR